MPSSNVGGKNGTEPPAQMVVSPKLNVGTILGVTVTVSVMMVSQDPGFGVNVYMNVPVVRLSTAPGLQVPVMPFVDVNGKAGTEPPAQMVVSPKPNVGLVFGVTLTV